MQFLYLLERIRNPVLDAFFSLITLLGDETLFIAIAIAVFWCGNKRTGYYLLTVGFFGTLLNQFLKIVCRVPRPWVRDPNFTIDYYTKVHSRGISLIGAHTNARPKYESSHGWWTEKDDAEAVLRLVKYGRICLSRLVEETYSPADAPAVYDRLIGNSSFPIVQFDWTRLCGEDVQ
jgi:hypothetical protein